MKQVKNLKIVIASPSDVQAERDMIPAIVDELNKGIADERGVRLEVYRWETDACPAFHPQGPQGQIDSCLRIEDCDLLIAIFWKRFGTPVLDAQSGTEHEIRLALESCEKIGRPQLMIYFNQTPHEPQSQAEKDQWQQVLDFKQTLSKKVLWWEYNGKDEFRESVRQHLTKFIRGDYSGPLLDELLQAYRDHLTRRISTVRIFGEAETRPLEKVFIELTLTEEYERPTANAQWLGMMDMELRRRRDIFTRDDEDGEPGLPKKDRGKEKRTLKPDELLRRRTQAVIVGAPGCGKTTLLRYLALKTLQAGKRFPVFLELKSLSEKAFEAADGNLVELLFAKAIAAPLGLSAAEAERCKAFFLARLKAGEVAIFLDGLDEVAGARFFKALCSFVNDFMASAYRYNDLIISTRPYALQHRFEGLQEMEIVSLNPRQIEAFLQHYYGDDPTTKKLQQELRRRRELQEMARVPFLLSVIAYLYRQQGEILGERLELYRQLVQQLVTQLDREKNVERFHLLDPDGSLKRDFLKRLAYERLFVDEVTQEAERLILTGEIIVAKACAFCQTHLTTNPHLLAADVKATPLLREIGAEAYAFVHLTLQEYLAAVALAEQADCEKVFCRAYFNPTLAEMEVLPMALGLVRKPDDFYAMLEELPESLNFANLRLRARGLAYVCELDDRYRTKLTERLIGFITWQRVEEIPYEEVVFKSFKKANSKILEYISNYIADLLYDEDSDVRWHATTMLKQISSERSVDASMAVVKDEDRWVRQSAVEALGEIGNERSIDALMAALKDNDCDVRQSAAAALGQIGSEHTVDALMDALKDEDSQVRLNAAKALGQIGNDRSVEALMVALKDEDHYVCQSAAEALAQIGGKRSVYALMAALNHENHVVRLRADEALGKIGNEASVDALTTALKNKESNMRLNLAKALGQIGSERSVNALITALKDEDRYLRLGVAEALGQIGSETSMDALITALKDEDRYLRQSSAEALGQIGSEASVEALITALKDEDRDVRRSAAKALGQIGSEASVNALITVLKDEHRDVRLKATVAIGQIGSEASVDALITALKDEDRDVRLKATAALRQIGSEASIDALITTLKDEDRDVRLKAAVVLGQIGSEASVDALITALKDDDRVMRSRATEALGQIDSERSVDALITTLKDEDSDVRLKVIAGLGQIGSKRCVDALITALKDEDRDVRSRVTEILGQISTECCVEALIIALKEEDRHMRSMVAKALGQIRSENSVDALMDALKDEDSYVRSNAAKALGRIGSERSVDVLLAALKDKDIIPRSAAEALGKMSDTALDNGLIHALSDNESFVRQKAAQVVGYYTTDKQVLATLQHIAANDPAEEVRTAALEAAEKYANKLQYFSE